MLQLPIMSVEKSLENSLGNLGFEAGNLAGDSLGNPLGLSAQSAVYESLEAAFGASKNGEILLCVADKQEAILAEHAARFFAFAHILGSNTARLKELDSIIFSLPDFRASFGDDLNSFRDELLELLVNLRKFYESNAPFKILISPFFALLNPLPKREVLKTMSLKKGSEYNFAELKNTLFLWGYEFVDIVELEGEASARGDILDVFVPGSPAPYRLSFFGDELESIRVFETQSQISNKNELDFLTLPPALFALDSAQHEVMAQKITESEFEVFSKDFSSLGLWYLEDLSDFIHKSAEKKFISQNAKGELKAHFELTKNIKIALGEFEKFELLSAKNYHDIAFPSGNLANFITANHAKKITLISPNEAGFKALNLSADLEAKITKLLAPFAINFASATESVLSLNKIDSQKAAHKKVKLKINELIPGDFIIHQNYGVGIFRGIFAEKIMGVMRDFIRIDYAGDDRLLLPVENLNAIERFVGDSHNLPIVDRLGKGSFAKLKEKVRQKLFAIANEIVRLAATRNLIAGEKITTSEIETKLKLQNFKNAAGFSQTADQNKAIAEIFADFESGRVMDRLLSGDVGFGKTEVAMNAIYAAFLSGFQSALIVPTTLLSTQHFKSLQTRLTGFGVNVARLDRFIKAKSSVLKGLASGEIHAVVGTHALLSADFKNLGLIIIDEEHKFGVKQKEKIKQLSANTHLLSMSATPIPRTLNMALSNIKTLSSLRTPPKERLPVRTFIKVASDALLKEVILRELRRGGGVFFIHNNIESIERQKTRLLGILPKLRIGVLHSQVDSNAAESIMLDFYEGRLDLLLATSIVESGIHLPNANTIIINHAERFGIADLHQLRGRVGRGSKEGFCYFLIRDLEALSDDSRARLIALEKNSHLGSGENLAYHDLEIRGAGNLLGETQSGHIKQIGYGLYLKMLEECLAALSQESVVRPKDAEVKIHLNAFLSSDLIPSDSLRLELYRRLCFCQSEAEVYEIEGEIEDRFGKLDENSLAFLALMRIKILATRAGISLLQAYERNISATFANGQKISFQAPTRDKDDVLESILLFLRDRLRAV